MKNGVYAENVGNLNSLSLIMTMHRLIYAAHGKLFSFHNRDSSTIWGNSAQKISWERIACLILAPENGSVIIYGGIFDVFPSALDTFLSTDNMWVHVLFMCMT